jgi:hypothetical protein
VEWQGRMVYLIANPPQRQLIEEMGLDPNATEFDLNDLKLRIRILKARREGISTIVAALFFIDTYNHYHRNSAVVAHIEDSASEIFNIYKRYYDNLPKEKKIKAQRSGGGELFWQDRDSRITVGTAGSVDIKSGATLHNLHKSEYAKWTGDVAAVDASLNIAARWGNIIEETTAKGRNHFYPKWQASKQRKNAYKAVFLAWFLDPRNTAPVIGVFTPTAEEAERMERYNLTPEQISWYREQEAESKELTPQEYPDSDRVAFLSSGKPVFNRKKLEQMEAYVETVKPLAAVRFRRDKESYSRLVREYAADTLKIFEEPRQDLAYLVVNDSASGINNDDDLDYCSTSVYGFGQFSMLSQVAHLYGRWEPHETAWLVYELWKWYHEGMIGVLSINHGTAVLSTLIHQCEVPVNHGLGWGGIYCHNPSDINERRKDLSAEQRLPGYPENKQTKDFMIGSAQEYITEDMVEVNSTITVGQLFTYAHLTAGKTGGEPGSHDDAVSDLACACAIHRLRGNKAKLGIGREGRQERRPMPPKTFIDSSRARR